MLGFVALLVSACQTAPSKRTEGSGLPSGKATVDIIENRVPIETQIAYAPRRFQEMESTVLLNPKIQDCLRAAPDIRETTFTVGLEGHLNYKGEVEHFHPSTPTESLKTCMDTAFKSLRFGRGRMGPFKMDVVRSKGEPEEGKKPKGILLELSGLKKWE